jgi:hypothetical protein
VKIYFPKGRLALSPARQGKATFNTFCHTQAKYADFALSLKARLWRTQAGYTNGGLQYRSDFIDSATHRMKGDQVDIGDNLRGRTGFSRPVKAGGDADLTLPLPVLGAGSRILRVSGAGNAYAGVLR